MLLLLRFAGRVARLSTLALALAAPGVGCDGGSRDVPLVPTADAGCLPMPQVCPEPLSCQVTTAPDGTRECSGTACCQSFCDLNACARCCATPPPQ